MTKPDAVFWAIWVAMTFAFVVLWFVGRSDIAVLLLASAVGGAAAGFFVGRANRKREEKDRDG